jgi:hypothetical protein
VGYSFPHTDNHAKEKLLEALSYNRPDVHLILGPASEALPRVEAMIQSTGCRVIARQQYAEDFLFCFDRSQAQTSLAPRRVGPKGHSLV